MSDREPIDGESVLADAGRAGAMMLYDWFKHMTTLSLVTLGGILGILQGSRVDVRPGTLGVMITAIAVAGILGFDGQNRLLVAWIVSLFRRRCGGHVEWPWRCTEWESERSWGSLWNRSGDG
jgi:hypothetical protein